MQQHRLEIANNFYWDCIDLYQRYSLTIEHLYDRKSSRLKCFIDLRIAYECILKACVIYFDNTEDDRESIIKMIQKFSHHTDKLEKVIVGSLPENIQSGIKYFSDDIKNLPIGLRYRLDTMDYIDALEDIYYKTVGQEFWLDQFAELVKDLSDFLGEHLNSHTKIVSLYDVFKPGELMKPEFNKYELKRKELEKHKSEPK